MTSLPKGPLMEYISVLDFLVKHDRFATCQKLRIQDPVLPAEKISRRVRSFLIRSNAVQQKIAIIAHTALFRFHRKKICNGMDNNNIRRLHYGLLVQNVNKYSQQKRYESSFGNRLC